MSEVNQVEADEKTELAAVRTVLGVERTFNAWMRTSIAFLAGGIALTRVMSDREIGELHNMLVRGASALLILIAVMITLYATFRYRERMQEMGKHKIRHWPLRVVFAIGFSLVAVCLVGLLCLGWL